MNTNTLRQENRIYRARRTFREFANRLAVLAGFFPAVVPALAADPYPRVGYQAVLSTLAHDVSGVVTIVDENTFRIDRFVYDGGGIVVYVYLGESDNHAAFVKGLQVGPQLRGTPFNNGTLIVDLPNSLTLDGFHAVSIWCVTAGMNFGSGSFQPPAYPRAGYSAVLPPGLHRTSGLATILDERTVRLDNFTYDGTAPLVFAYLGETNSYDDFLNGPAMAPQIVQVYDRGTLTVQLPPGRSLNGFGALSIWCVDFRLSITSASFPKAMHDLDLDGDIDPLDGADFCRCLSGPADSHSGVPACNDADQNGDGDVDLRDYQALQRCASGQGSRAQISCANE